METIDLYEHPQSAATKMAAIVKFKQLYIGVKSLKRSTDSHKISSPSPAPLSFSFFVNIYVPDVYKKNVVH